MPCCIVEANSKTVSCGPGLVIACVCGDSSTALILFELCRPVFSSPDQSFGLGCLIWVPGGDDRPNS